MNSSLVLVVNCGSSSLKLAVVESKSGERVIEALAERLFTPKASMEIRSQEMGETRIGLSDADHGQAFEVFATHLAAEQELNGRIIAVSHRVVHGGEYFHCPVLVDEDVLQKIEVCSGLAPLHNPANLQGIHAARKRFPGLPQVAVFDTAFHQTLPETAYLYAIPYGLYEQQQLRRYGFHGTSHHYLMLEAARRLGQAVEKMNLLTVHLGNGRCQPWRAKRRLVDPSSREAALFSRRALRQRENKVGLRTRRPVIWEPSTEQQRACEVVA
ncbi:hypothetical protein [Thiolapillus sp.]|uniref:hypothetical protein n=1 Tax=Thiolapillus sp. TaxID=2017437 RepID=UPI003AF57D63